jgi:hypothetical protein
MSMTKKEQAVVAELRQALALHRTGPVERDVQPPAAFANPDVVGGWDFNTYTLRVYPAWLTFSLIYRANNGDESTPAPLRGMAGWSRECHPIWSTKLLALRALRYAIEQEAAKKLADIDARIEAGA